MLSLLSYVILSNRGTPFQGGLTLSPQLAMSKVTESKEITSFLPNFFSFMLFSTSIPPLAESKWKPKGMRGAFCNYIRYHLAVFRLCFRCVQFLIKAKVGEETVLVLKNCFWSISPCSAFIKWTKIILEGRSSSVFAWIMQVAPASDTCQIQAIEKKTPSFMSWTCSSILDFISVAQLLLLHFSILPKSLLKV